MPRISQLQMASQRLHQQISWMEQRGNSLYGYYETYKDTNPDDWEAIYRADLAELRRLRAEVERLERRQR